MKSDLFEGDHALLRRESFGGTLLLVKTGKRTYVTCDEYDAISSRAALPERLATELGTKAMHVKVVEPKKLYREHFSAPDTVFLEVTRACNLTCTHCFNSSGRMLPNQLTHVQLEEIIDDLAESGVQEIRFTGGEPMSIPGIITLIRRAASYGLRCSMGTNATLISERKADALKQAGLHAGIVSLDGLEGRHDDIRGSLSFRRALEGLGRLRARNIDVRVNIVVMRSSLSDLQPLIEMLCARGISVFMRRLILSGRATSSSEEMLSAAEYEELRVQLQPLLNDSRATVDGHYMKERCVTTRIQLPFVRKNCSAGHRGLVVLPDGRVQTCGFLGPLGEGSVGTLPATSLENVWARLNSSAHIADLELNLAPYNRSTSGPQTNCLAIALAGQAPLVQLRRSRKEMI